MQILWKKFKKIHIDANVSECGIEEGVPNTKYQYQVHQDAVVHIITEGSGYFSCGSKTYELHKGDLFFLLNGEEVSYYPSYKNPWTYYWVGMSGKQILDYLNRSLLFDQKVITNSDTQAVEAIIRKSCELSSSIESNNSNDILLLQYLYKLVYQLQAQFPKSYTTSVNIINQDMQKAIQYINNNYYKNIQITDVAQYANLTRSYLYKLFKKSFDVSPKSYLTYIRMYHASELLKQTNLPIKQIAENVGYQDPLLFSKNFKQHFEMTATNYRNYNG